MIYPVTKEAEESMEEIDSKYPGYIKDYKNGYVKRHKPRSYFGEIIKSFILITIGFILGVVTLYLTLWIILHNT